MTMAISRTKICALAAALLSEIVVPAQGFSPKVRYDARRWAPATATGATAMPTLDAGGISPVPTGAARQPELAGMELFKRDYTMGTDTCGFAAEFKSEPWTCYRVGASCVSTGTYLGCCAGSEPDCYSTIITSCQSYNQNAICGLNDLCCPSTAPSCFTWQFSTYKSPGTTYSLFNCYASGGVGTLVDAPPGLTTNSPKPSTSSSAKKTSSKPASTTPDSAETTTTSPPAATQAANSSESSTNVGAIVGGAVGGVAIIALAILAIVLIMRRKPSAASPAGTLKASPSIASPVPAPGPAPGFPPPGGSPAHASIAPSSMVSPQMSQTGYFPGPTPPPQPHLQQQHMAPPGAAGYAMSPDSGVLPYGGAAGGYYDPSKSPQPSPVPSDPRYSNMVQPQYMGPSTATSAGSSPWSATAPHQPPAVMQPPPAELSGANPVGSHTNPAQLS